MLQLVTHAHAQVSCACAWHAHPLLVCEVCVKTSAKTGVEMEAMMAASVGCLTVYDMVKAVERGIEVRNICLLEKKGGKTGDYLRV